MRQGREYTEEVKCVYQNIGLTSQAKADNIVADSIFSCRFKYLQSLKISMDILHHEVLDKGPSFTEFPPFYKNRPRGKFKKKGSSLESCWLADFC